MALIDTDRESTANSPTETSASAWLNNSIGRAGFGLNITGKHPRRASGRRIVDSRPEAKKHFANLSAQKEDIEGKLGFELDWQELPDAKACRIASWYPHASIERSPDGANTWAG